MFNKQICTIISIVLFHQCASTTSQVSQNISQTKDTNSQRGIKSDFIKGLNELGIINPTEIQAQVIPLLLAGNTDLVGQAQTGTGKTAAFGLPLLHKIDSKKKHLINQVFLHYFITTFPPSILPFQ